MFEVGDWGDSGVNFGHCYIHPISVICIQIYK